MPSTGVQQKTVLIVDDDTEFRRLVMLWLEELDVRVVEASNGQDGLQALRDYAPCVVLLDLMMPVLDGRGFRAQQLRDPVMALVPVICLSASHDVSLIAEEIAATACMPKPVDWERLLARVGELCL